MLNFSTVGMFSDRNITSITLQHAFDLFANKAVGPLSLSLPVNATRPEPNKL